MVNNLSNSFKDFVEYMKSEEGKRNFAKTVVRNRIKSILFGYKTEHLSEENAVKYLEELIEDQKEITRKKMIDDRLSESDGVE